MIHSPESQYTSSGSPHRIGQGERTTNGPELEHDARSWSRIIGEVEVHTEGAGKICGCRLCRRPAAPPHENRGFQAKEQGI
jgi:hypothetical protein